MTSLIQACKILTALLTLNNSSSLLCCPPFPLTALSSSSFHSISLPLHFFPSFYTLSYLPFASMFLPEQRRLKCEVSINPVACKSFCLLQWLPQARWWGQWSDCHTRTHTHTHTHTSGRHCTSTCAVGPRYDGRKQEVDLFEHWCPDSCTHMYRKHTHTHTQTLTQLQLPQCSHERRSKCRARERERVNVNLSVGTRDRRG